METALSLSRIDEGDGGLLIEVGGFDVSLTDVEAGTIFTDVGSILDTSSPDLTVNRLFLGLTSVVVVV